jgi:hypothetical protein
MSWAEIGACVGQRNLSTTADIYTHVLMDYREIDRAKLLGLLGKSTRSSSRPGRPMVQSPVFEDDAILLCRSAAVSLRSTSFQ